jgi:hypothetical protein
MPAEFAVMIIQDLRERKIELDHLDINSEVVYEICHDELNDLKGKIIVALASQEN